MKVVERASQLIKEMPAGFWFLWIGTLINRLGGFVVPFLALYLTGERGLSVGTAALVVSLFGAGSFAASFIGGELSDRIGRRPVMLASFLVTPVVTMAVGLVRELAVIAAGTLLLGFVTDLYRPAVNAAVADMTPPRLRTRAYGYIYWAINIGASVAPIGAGFMAGHNYTLLFAGDAATTLLCGLLILWRIKETQPQSGTNPSGPSSAHAAGKARRERFLVIMSDPFFLSLAGLSLLIGVIYAQSYSNLAVDMMAHGLSAAEYGLAIAANGIVIALVGLPVSHISTRWNRFGALGLSALLLGAGFGMNALAHDFPFYVVSVVVWSLGEITGATVRPAVVADLSPVHVRGLYQGVFGSTIGLAYFIGPAAGGWVFQRFGSSTLWAACLVIGLVAAVAYLAMSRPGARRIAAIASGATQSNGHKSG